MNQQHRSTAKAALLALLLVSSSAVFAAEAAAPASKDVVLDLLPSDCPVCIKINNLQSTLGQLDQYIAGASPIPVALSMLATMQLAGIVGDPLLTGIDMQGTFAIGIMQLDPTGNSLTPFAMVPLASPGEFLKNTNLDKGDADGIYLLSAANSPVGNLAVMPLKDKKYLLVTLEPSKSDLLAISKSFKEKKASLASKLDTTTGKAAANTPAWAYVNIDKLHQLYKEDINSAIEEAQNSIAAQGGDTGDMLKGMVGMIQSYAEQADWITLSIKPTPQLLQVETAASAKAGTELAGMLKPAESAGKAWQTAGYANGTGAVKFVGRINKPLMDKVVVKMMDTFVKTASETDKPQLAKLKTIMDKWMPLYGNEFAGSFSYRAGMPPFEMIEMMEVKDGKNLVELQKESMGPINSIYAAMGVKMDFSYVPSVEKYKGIDIGLYQLKMDQDPNNPAAASMEAIYGKQGLQYPVAISNNRFLVSMGPDAMNQLKAMIDKPAAGTVDGELKRTLDTIPDSTRAEAVASINILKLVKGALGLATQMSQQTGVQIPDLLSGIDMTTTSNMSAAAYIEPGKVRTVAILPKEHLMEIVKVVLQIQQKSTALAAQPANPLVGSSSAKEEVNAEEDEMLQYIGKPAPEMTMKDTSGREIILSKLKGKPVVLYVWATWCPPCKETSPLLINLRKETKEADLAIVGISNESVEKIKAAASVIGYNFPLVSHPDDLPGFLGQIAAIPTTVFIDANGVVQDIRTGTFEPNELKNSMDKILKK